MPDDGDGLAPDQRGTPLGEADSTATLNQENEELNRWGHFSLAVLTAEQEMAAAADPLGGDCEEEEDLATRRRRELLEEPNPVLKLERYAYSDIVFNRQLVARNIVDTLRMVMNSQDDIDSVLSVLASLSLDCEPSVRTELVEQLPNIAVFCASEAGPLENVVREHVVPILVQYLTDVTNQVRKRTHVSLLFILERALIDRKQLEEQICSLVVHLTENENMDDYRMEAVTLMTKMAPFLGQETTAVLFLPRFIRLCQDSSFHIRKACASHFGDFFSIVGQVHLEDNLGVFQMLCEDCVWGVRKACAEVFMPVSCVCSLATRRSSLAPLFVGLLEDQARWVRVASFQTLGPFISTFADPERTGLYCSPAGVISVRSRANSFDAGPERKAAGTAASAPLLPVLVQGGPKDSTTATVVHSAPQCHAPQAHSEEAPAVDEDVHLLSQGEQQGVCEEEEEEEEEPWPDDSDLAAAEHCQEDAALPLPEEPTWDCIEPVDKPIDPAWVCTEPVDQPIDPAWDCTELASRPIDRAWECGEPDTTGHSVGDNGQPLKNILGGLENPGENTDTKECLSVEGDRQRLVLHVDSSAESNFNTFQFWRVPIPEVEVDIEFLGDRATAVRVRAKSQDQDNRCFSSDLNVELLPPDNDHSTAAANSSDPVPSQQSSGISMQRLTGDTSTLRIRTASLASLTSADQECNLLLSSSITEASVAFNEAGEVAGVHKVRTSEMNVNEMEGSASAVFSRTPNSGSDNWSPHDQDIVPVPLLERYQTMVDPSLAQNVDSEIGRHCAHSLPAVALTLGRRFWPCLRTTYQALVSDVQWKVRHIVASCLHELATILGPQIASQDLVPSFEGFVRDVDEVRVGLLERLGHFLRGLGQGDQRRSLPLLADFLCTDNHRNWRFRHTLARQLCELAELYNPLDINQYLVPVASELLLDKVAEVRHKSVDAVTSLLHNMASQPLVRKQFVRDLCTKAHDQKWAQRQLFCLLVEEMAFQDCMTREEFLVIALPKLLKLCNDSVPNVRMATAHCLATTIAEKVKLWHLDDFYQDQVRVALAGLKEDLDRDVRYSAHLPPREGLKREETIEVATE